MSSPSGNTFMPDEIVKMAIELWSGERPDDSVLPSRHNLVCRFLDNKTHAKRILRITPAPHRSANDLMAELDYLQYLRQTGCAAVMPVASTNSRLVESLGAEDFHAVAFEEIEGDLIAWGDERDDTVLLAKVGGWLGKLHSAAVDFRPQRAARFHWFEDEFYKEPELCLPDSEPELQKEMGELVRWLNARPADRQNYGLIHGDLVPENYLRIGDGIIAFDFDDCTYHWFAFDIAVAVEHVRMSPPTVRRNYLAALLDGYRSQMSFGDMTSKDIEWFSRLLAMNRFVSAVREASNTSPDELLKLVAHCRRDALEPISWD